MTPALATSFEGKKQPKNEVPTPPHLGLPSGMNRPAALFFEVDETGQPTDVKAFTLGGPLVIKDKTKSELMKSTFRPAICNGTPVKGEMNILYP